MPLVKDQAIAIRRLDYSESSQVLVFFTRQHGKQRLIAKGIKRGTKTRFATGIDLLERGSLVFSRREEGGRSLGTLTEWGQQDVFADLRKHLGWMYAGQYAAEAIDVSTEDNDPSPRLYDAAVRLLESVADEEGVALARFQCVLLEEIGLMPELASCVSCGRRWSGRTRAFFSARQGGLICDDCEGAQVEKRRIDPVATVAISSRRISRDVAVEAFDLLDYHLTESLGRRLRLSTHVRQALFGPRETV